MFLTILISFFILSVTMQGGPWDPDLLHHFTVIIVLERPQRFVRQISSKLQTLFGV